MKHAVPERAVVGASIAPLHAEARIASPQLSQRLRGASLEVLERAGDGMEWHRVRGDDGYEGWVHRGYLGGANAGAPFTHLSLGCAVQTSLGRRLPLPLGALIRDAETLADGEAIPIDAVRAKFPRQADAIAEHARTAFDGAPYQWGGITPWGADCSGLVQTLFALHGVPLPRDAWQQAEADPGGATTVDLATSARLSELRPADLLFFSDRPDRRITHVGIALGGSQMAHAALGRGGFAVDRLDDGDDPYVAKLLERLLFARRLLG